MNYIHLLQRPNQLRRGHTIVVDVFDNWFPVASVAFLGRHEFSNHVDIHLNNGRVLRKVRGGRSVCVRQ